MDGNDNLKHISDLMSKLSVQPNQSGQNMNQMENFYEQESAPFNIFGGGYDDISQPNQFLQQNAQSQSKRNMNQFKPEMMPFYPQEDKFNDIVNQPWDDSAQLQPNMSMSPNMNLDFGKQDTQKMKKGKKGAQRNQMNNNNHNMHMNNQNNSNPMMMNSFKQPNNAGGMYNMNPPMNFDNMGGMQNQIYSMYYGNPSNQNQGQNFINNGELGGINQINNYNLFPQGMGMNMNNMGSMNNMGMNFPGLNFNNNLSLNMPPNSSNVGLNMNMNPNMGRQNFKQKNQKQVHHQKKESVEPPSLEDIIEKAAELAKDHSGSRLVQRKYEEANDEERAKIFEKIKPEILSLSKDVFGNYAIQKILEFKDPEKNRIIFEMLKGKMYDLSLHMYGCRVIQQLLNVIDDEYIPEITEELKPQFSKCIEDQNGNHVIQKIIERLKQGEDNGIFNVVLENAYTLSIHQYGCRVIQKLFNQCNEEQKEKLLSEIFKSTNELCQDQYGNYVIQFILEKQKGENCPEIYLEIKGKIFTLSTHKFGSNVIEKALCFGTKEQKKEIIDEILKKDEMINDSLLNLVKDKYGNYVVQKMIEYSDKEIKDEIIRRIVSSQSLKKRDGFSKHVINFIEKMGLQVAQDNTLMAQGNQTVNPNNMMVGMTKGGNLKKNKNNPMNQGKNNQGLGQMGNPNQMMLPNPMNMNFNEDFGQVPQQAGNPMYYLGENNFGLDPIN